MSTGLSSLREAFRALINRRVADCPSLGTVLVVDDDPEVITCLGVRLQLAGYEMLDACDGEKGLAAIVEHRPDAVVLDVRMPKMDGIEMLRAVRSNELIQHTPVVVLSANIREQQRASPSRSQLFSLEAVRCRRRAFGDWILHAPWIIPCFRDADCWSTAG